MINEYGSILDRNGYSASIVQNDLSICFNHCKSPCSGPLNRHEVFGGPFRQKSKRLGLWVCLCHYEHHQFGPQSVHNNAQAAFDLKKRAQLAAMETYGWSKEDFIREFGRNYLDD